MARFHQNSFYLFYILAIALYLSACGDKDSSKARKVSSSDSIQKKVGNNPLLEKLASRPPVPAENCEEAIKSALCISKTETSDFDSDCDASAVTTDQSTAILESYRELPPILQQALCQIHRVQIHSTLDKVAYAASLETSGRVKQKVFIVGLRDNLLLPHLEQKDFISGKEQNSFTNNPEIIKTLRSDGPSVIIESKSKASQRMVVLAHELSHIIDFQNDITSFTIDECSVPQKDQKSGKNYQECSYKPNRFSSISWGEETFKLGEDNTPQLVVNEANKEKDHKKWLRKFPNIFSLCFYLCTHKSERPNIIETYEELSRSSFPTLYASTSAAEDFAESLSLWILKKEAKLKSYTVYLRSPKEPDTHLPIIKILDHLESPSFAPKKSWFEKNIK